MFFIETIFCLLLVLIYNCLFIFVNKNDNFLVIKINIVIQLVHKILIMYSMDYHTSCFVFFAHSYLIYGQIYEHWGQGLISFLIFYFCPSFPSLY